MNNLIRTLSIFPASPPLVPTHPALVSNPSPQAVEHPQLNSQHTVTAPSNPALTTSFIQAQCLDSSMTSLIGPSKRPVLDGNNPSIHLQHHCPICFPAHHPAAFDRWCESVSINILTLNSLSSHFSGQFKGVHCILCLDGNFAHKRCRHAGKGDQLWAQPHSFSIPEDVITDMARESAVKI